MVLTVRPDASFPAHDPTLAREVPDAVIVRRTRITEFYGTYRGVGGARGPVDVATRARGESLRAGLLRWIRAALFVPDGRAGWIPHAVGPAVRLAREERASVLFSSGPPFTTNVIGSLVHARTGIPWIQDYRDPWIRAPFYPTRPKPVARLEARIEGWMLSRAARTLTVNREIREELLADHPGADPRKLVVLPNGFDEADFEHVERIEPPKLTFVHTGTLFAARDPQAFRTALEQLCLEEPEFAESVEVVLAGRIDADVEARFRTPPLDRLTRFPGYLEHHESIRLLRSAHVCLLFVGEERGARGMLTGKLFEYLGSGTPILALAPEGEAAGVVRACGAGWVVAPADGQRLVELLRSLWRKHRSGTRRFLEPDREAVQGFSRRRQTEKLAALLDEVRGDGPR
jgi:glycosyltransferase involved in cell wall biosynthesis